MNLQAWDERHRTSAYPTLQGSCRRRNRVRFTVHQAYLTPPKTLEMLTKQRSHLERSAIRPTRQLSSRRIGAIRAV